MADERKTGPVRPPVIDLTARPGSGAGAKPRPAQAPRSSASPATEKPSGAAAAPRQKQAAPGPSAAGKPTPPPDAGGPAGPTGSGGWYLAVMGGMLGLAGAYVLALAGFWPVQPAPVPDLSPLENRVAALESVEVPDLSGLATRAELDDAFAASSQSAAADLETLGQRLDTLEARPEPDLAALGDRIDAVEDIANAALGAGETGEAVPATLVSELRADLSALSRRVDSLAADVGASLEANDAAITRSAAERSALQAELAGLQSGLEGLDTRLQDLNAAFVDQISGAAEERSDALAALQAAITAGQPFAAEADVLGLVIPARLAARAETGVMTSGALAALLTDRMPDILNAMLDDRPEGDPVGRFFDQLAASISLRPAGDLEGTDPPSVLARLEAALERGDITTARDAFAALPEPVQTASGEFAAELRLRAEAEDLLAHPAHSAEGGS